MAASTLATFEHVIGGLAQRRAVSHVPAQGTLDDELRQQRPSWVRIYSFGIGIFGLVWCVAFVLYALLAGHTDRLIVAVTVQAAVLGGAGWYALYRCSLGRLRRATYTNFAALLFAATTNLDVNMPRMDGIEVLERIKGDEHLRMLPVIMLTSTDNQTEIDRCYGAGASGYVAKPVNITSLGEKLQRLGMFLEIVELPEVA